MLMKIKTIACIIIFSVVLFYASGALFFCWEEYESRANYGVTYIYAPEGADTEKIKEEYGQDIIIIMPAPADPDTLSVPDEPENSSTLRFRDIPFTMKLYVIYTTAFGMTVFFLDETSLLFASRLAYMTVSCRIKCNRSKTRLLIYEYIKTHPGCIASEIIFDLKIGKSTLRYHLASDLNKNVRKINADGKSHYFLKAAGFTEQETFHIIHMRNDLKSQIYSKIDENPGISVRELAEALDQKKSSVRYHLKIMAECQEICIKKEKNRETYYCMHDPDLSGSGRALDD